MCVLLCAITFWVPCRRVHVVFTFYLCFLAHSGVQRILCCVVFLLWFSSSYVASFSELSTFECPFRYSLTFIFLCLGLSRIYIYIFTLPYQQSLFVIRCFRIGLTKSEGSIGYTTHGTDTSKVLWYVILFCFSRFNKNGDEYK